MAKQDDSRTIWIVVEVASGIPVLAEAYHDEKTAMAREQTLRKEMHPENNETGVFEIKS